MKKRRLSFTLFLFFFISCSLFAEEIVAKSSIKSVIIYPDRATIIREAALSLGSGIHSVVFDGLPVTLIPNSLRASGKGVAIVKVLGIDLSSQYLESPLLPEIEKLQIEIDALVLEMNKTKDRIEVLDQLPISQNTKIEIKDQNITPAPSKKDEKGVLTWKFTMAPKEKREILIGFTIEYPKGSNIRGL